MSLNRLHITKLFCKFKYYTNNYCDHKECDEHPQRYSGVPEKSTTFLLNLYLLIDSIYPAVVYRIVDVDILVSPSVYRIVDVARIAFHILRVPSVDIHAIMHIFCPDRIMAILVRVRGESGELRSLAPHKRQEDHARQDQQQQIFEYVIIPLHIPHS